MGDIPAGPAGFTRYLMKSKFGAGRDFAVLDPDTEAQLFFVDGKLVWVGTSGGVVRYDTRDDSYKLFDVKSGLLSNGVFYVGRIKGQIARLSPEAKRLLHEAGINTAKDIEPVSRSGS